MLNLNESLNEIYLNYDTLEMLKDNTSESEILEMFSNDLNYSKSLTKCLLNLNKIFLKSVVMRIKVCSKQNPKDLKSSLLKYNDSLEPLIDKLLSTTSNTELIEETNDEVIDDNASDNEDLSDESILENFLNTGLEETNDGNDLLKLTDIFKKFSDDYEHNLQASVFKKLIKSKLGKPEGKGDNSVYKGYRLN